MKKMMIAALLVLTTTSVFAKTTTCYLVEDFDDWRVTLEGNRGDFFDNDSNMPLVKSKFTNSDALVFEGRDSNSVAFFALSQDKKSGKLHIVYPAQIGEEQTFEFNCQTK